MRALLFALAPVFAAFVAAPALAASPDRDAPFVSIDGGTLSLAQWSGQPVLVVNTASRCGYTPQYEGLQTLYDTYRDKGLVVLAVPSDDFNQELATAEEVKDFCAINYDLTLPMTDITPVKGAKAHPFYQWVRQNTDFQPRWNFNKVLVGRDGRVLATFGSNTEPMSAEMTRQVEAALKG
ncbi:glutathione peroxidase [Oceaniglobus roseus]|uniref:glutathione peroxidase n=1 Tax=Oceaniglobus roseus TaxID=1737570 RepID=UPI000C7F2236|nr:glutathione peroxidase [Kandeliimicrobium roseum]